MAKGESPAVVRDIHTLFHVGTSTGLTDAQLLDRFRARADLTSSEAAFAGLMARHGPMVLGVCRRALSNPDDVADAFQATFLILVRKADSVRVEDSLGRWLYGVSRRVSVRAKLAAARRTAREVRGIELVASPTAEANPAELRSVLDEEIGRLPEKFRSAVVLCELEGLGHDEAARQLGCPVGTVKSRLSRAHEKLRSRLTRRGVAPTILAVYVNCPSPAVPAVLMEATASAAFGYADAAISPAVNLLIRGVLRAMLLKKLWMIGITVVASLALASGAGVLARQPAVPAPWNEPGGQQAELARSSNDELGQPSDREGETTDLMESLRLDIELLSAEVRARMVRIETTNADVVQADLADANSNEKARSEQLRTALDRYRKDYFSKKKELRQKQAELTALQQRRDAEEMKKAQMLHLQAGKKSGANRQETSTEKPVSTTPAPSGTPGLSPALDKRFSGIDRKLDKILKTLDELKRETSE